MLECCIIQNHLRYHIPSVTKSKYIWELSLYILILNFHQYLKTRQEAVTEVGRGKTEFQFRRSQKSHKKVDSGIRVNFDFTGERPLTDSTIQHE